jgi:RNA polymerase sigma factor (sigma-70 family)
MNDRKWAAPEAVSAILAKPGAAWTDAERRTVQIWIAEEHYDELIARCVYAMPPHCSDYAGDVVNEFVIGIKTKTDRYDPQRGTFRPYILECLQNYAHDWLRKNAPSPAPGSSGPEREVCSVEKLPDPFLRDAIQTCLQTLTPVQCKALLLVADGYKPAEIAEKLQVRQGHARVIIHNGRRKLAQCLTVKRVPLPASEK